MSGLVQSPAATGTHREHATGRDRSELLSATDRACPSGMTYTKEFPGFPGRFLPDLNGKIGDHTSKSKPEGIQQKRACVSPASTSAGLAI